MKTKRVMDVVRRSAMLASGAVLMYMAVPHIMHSEVLCGVTFVSLAIIDVAFATSTDNDWRLEK